MALYLCFFLSFFSRTPPALKGYRYFITHIDYLSYYGYVEIINEKLYCLVAFEEFEMKMKLQKIKKLKAVKSDRMINIMLYMMRLDRIQCRL